MVPDVTAWDPGWAAQFEAERTALAACLAPWLVDGVHHIGSTAIPGMPAKPVVDMIAGVDALERADDAEAPLAALGYLRRPHRVDAVAFVRRSGDRHTHHLHLTRPGSDLWRERLAFRDALRADPDLVARYTQLKADLLRASGGAPYDAADKRAFVRQVLAGTGVDLRDGLHVDR